MYSKNNLEEDVEEGMIFQNISYNLYKIKSDNLQALLIGLLNNENKDINNYGYIEDNPTKKIKDKKFILLGVDIPGMNMPLRLHIQKDIVLDVLNSVQKGKTSILIWRYC